MERRVYLRLCTFEVATHLGRHRRLGTYMDGRIADLNFATAWYMAQTGEPEPQRMADALVPANVCDYLRAGLRALHTAEELFLGAGPEPTDWWLSDPPPRGPHGETLAYQESEVRLIGLFGTEEEIPGPANCEWEIAALPDGRRCLAGYTLLIRSGRRTHLGPYLVTAGEIGDPSQLAWTAHVNGSEVGSGKLGRSLRPDPSLAAGEVIGSGTLGSVSLRPGDVFELAATPIGVLRRRALA